MKARWLLCVYALSNAALYSMFLPLWEGFDEPFHFGYVQSMANVSGFPDPRTSRPSQEVGASLRLAPASRSVQRNLPETTAYAEFFRWPEGKRQRAREGLSRIDSNLRLRPSHVVNYEALQAPLAYAALALHERALATLPLVRRVLALRILAGTLGALLLLFGAGRLARQIGMTAPYNDIAIFCALSSQMLWATLATPSRACRNCGTGHIPRRPFGACASGGCRPPSSPMPAPLYGPRTTPSGHFRPQR